MAGDERTGVCIMRLTAGLDSGPVCLPAEEPIGADDTYGTLAARLAALGGELLVEALDTAPPFVEQDEARRHLRREDHRRGPRCSTRDGPPPSSSASCARCARTSARRSTGRRDGERLGVWEATAPPPSPAIRRPGSSRLDGRRVPGARLRAGHPGADQRCSPPGASAMPGDAYLRGLRS